MISSTRYRAIAEINRQTDLSQQIAKLQESVSTGKSVTKSSDNPDAMQRITEIRQTQADQVVWTANTNMGASISSAADTQLGSIEDMLNQAKELLLSGRNDTTSTSDRTAIAAQLRAIVANLNAASTTSDPTGAPLFPTATPLSIPVSDTLSLPATAQRDQVFGNVTTASGVQTLQQILNDAATAVEGNAATRATDIQTSLDAIDAGSAHITQIRSDQGVRGARFDAAKDDLDTSGETLSEERNGLESTDLTYALSEFQAKQTALQAAQTLFAQSNKTSLFNLMG
ncbi:MAG TPA: flagellin [Sphingomonas sp.]|uniref:flagellin n=1 Tax=Sphingomonas sp. TaxID=28214 RepID=UPI002C6680B4|nr:flagellin [Sphingomonas sp.]HMI19552.1 flagellin [Sphingomonas sp.]